MVKVIDICTDRRFQWFQTIISILNNRLQQPSYIRISNSFVKNQNTYQILKIAKQSPILTEINTKQSMNLMEQRTALSKLVSIVLCK